MTPKSCESAEKPRKVSKPLESVSLEPCNKGGQASTSIYVFCNKNGIPKFHVMNWLAFYDRPVRIAGSAKTQIEYIFSRDFEPRPGITWVYRPQKRPQLAEYIMIAYLKVRNSSASKTAWFRVFSVFSTPNSRFSLEKGSFVLIFHWFWAFLKFWKYREMKNEKNQSQNEKI